ncbi:hypothetical protein PHYSODRAFT_361328 [Phytophthora sojae]|uniref:Uncharacterized protein n=1 Tax=Phytophthora sojae (strain P6497) TaxID=1094619 RepID=G4ZQZ4_PHYSP|nr:hypothetical protein PHYSODRAFT_361328 [Phytophthora sojae]EGZ14074.1 hypothetical protein PHYSODRAFT_361328 [Phytophthora sojae]|eukprot:XP_009531503.1 hypothetical protein PHYSODRAFT_361328 [Phytophthora sojae]
MFLADANEWGCIGASHFVSRPSILKSSRFSTPLGPLAIRKMEQLQRSLSERLASTPLETNVDFIDQDGVIRRSCTVTKPMLMQGASVGKLEFLSTELDDDKPQSSAVLELSSVRLSPLATRSVSESEMNRPIPREERVRRCTQFQLQLRERKHSILVEQNTRHEERSQLWHDASELDPDVETTSENTVRTPSPRSQTYVDEDGNVRRKSSAASFGASRDTSVSNDQGTATVDGDNATPKSPPSPIALVFGQGKASPTPPRISASLVLEFAQTINDS